MNVHFWLFAAMLLLAINSFGLAPKSAFTFITLRCDRGEGRFTVYSDNGIILRCRAYM